MYENVRNGALRNEYGGRRAEVYIRSGLREYRVKVRSRHRFLASHTALFCQQ